MLNNRNWPILMHFFFSFAHFGLISFVTIYAQKNNIMHAGFFFTMLAVSSILVRVIIGKVMRYDSSSYLLDDWE